MSKMNTPLKYASVITISKMNYPENTFVLFEGKQYSIRDPGLDFSKFHYLFFNDPWYFTEPYFEFAQYKDKIVDISILLTSICGIKVEHAHKNSFMTFISILYNYLSQKNYNEIFKIKKIAPTTEGLKQNLLQIGELIEVAIKMIIADSYERDLLNRVMTIEMPLVHYYFNLSKEGLNVNVQSLGDLLNEIDETLFSYKYSNLYMLEIPEFDKEDIVSLKRQKTSLLKILSGDGWINPLFDIWGTVSSRIMIREPYLQFVSSKHRNEIFKTIGGRLIYPDYTSFEPAIIAGEVGGSFLKIFNNGQLYELISKYLFHDDLHRTEAKIFFLSLVYGRNEEVLNRDVANKASVLESEMLQRINQLKTDFEDLFTWLDKIKVEGKAKKVVGKDVFNPRFLTEDYNPWIISHHVQSIASIIFKELLLALIKNGIKPLIPMHDGAICELVGMTSKDDTEKIFIEIFQRRYPDVKIKVKIDELN